MQIQHKHYNARRMGSLGALLGCLIAAAGCASDQEARRGDTTARERAQDRREVRRDRDRDRNGVRDDREAVIAREGDALDEDVGVKPVAVANPSAVRDNVGEREPVKNNIRDRSDVRDRDYVQDGDPNRTANDRELTSRIRQSIVDDDELSTKAKNVEIIAKNGAVTLRGPVSTAQEKSRVESHAQNQAGAKRVTNQIEVLR